VLSRDRYRRGAAANLARQFLSSEPVRERLAQRWERCRGDLDRRLRRRPRLADRLDDVDAGELLLVNLAHEVFRVLLGPDDLRLALTLPPHHDDERLASPLAAIFPLVVGGAHY